MPTLPRTFSSLRRISSRLITEVLRDIQKRRPDEINTVMELKRTFDNYNVEYEHLIEGQRFIFGVDSTEAHEEDV